MTDEIKELMCTNQYCYVKKDLQKISEHEEEICYNCGFDLKPWKPSKKTETPSKASPKKKKVKS